MIRIAPLVLLLVGACADPESYRPLCTSIYNGMENLISRCMEREAANERGRQAAPALAIVFGAGSAALAEHNFYVYEVPRARRYLGR